MISIIIVHYKNEKDILECLNSLYSFKYKTKFEVIIVDNSGNKNIIRKISKFNNLRYVYSPSNLGYGAGMNFGAKHAKGEYLFILNPDVVFNKNILDGLISDFKNGKTAIVAPILLDTKGNVMDQGAKDINPIQAIIKFSFLDKLFPNNNVSKNYWVKNWNKKLVSVDNVPGTAFVIRKEIFNKLNGFDENFFLYFEEFDLCKRVKKLDYKIFIDSTLKLTHKWGTTTKLISNKDNIFKTSRFKYFKKHFGLIGAWLLESFLFFTPLNILFLAILSTAFFVRFFNLEQSVNSLIGDQGWFYLSAKDILINHQIPLVGITSSHTWLHQGPLWTYILALIFSLSNFNPISPSFFTVLLDTFTLVLLFIISKTIFNSRAAILAALIYGFSPYIVHAARMPYHTSFIPILSLLFFFSTYKWLKGSTLYFSLSLLFVSLLYNFELQTTVLYVLLGLVFLYGSYRKAKWAKNLMNKKSILLSLTLFLIPLIPIIVYDVSNGFKQTIVFAGWTLYKGLSVFNFSHSGSFANMTGYFSDFIARTLFISNGIISLILLLTSLLYFVYELIIKKLRLEHGLMLIYFLFMYLSVIASKTTSDAYLYSLIIPTVFMVSVFLSKSFNNKYLFCLIVLVVSSLSFLNASRIVKTNLQNTIQAGYLNKVNASKFMVKNSQDKSFQIVGIGPGSQFKSFTDEYKFLSWYYGGNPQENANIKYVLYETQNGIKIKRGE